MITVSIPKHLLLSANDRVHYRAKAVTTKLLRDQAYWISKTAGKQKPLQAADLVITIHWPALKRRRDRLNLAPTIKACVDGMVDAGILPDDDDSRIHSETLITAKDHCEPQYGAVLDFKFLPIEVTA